jgi:serine-type D-Ala-D-Ala carboxypeptidase/endopeptidase
MPTRRRFAASCAALALACWGGAAPASAAGPDDLGRLVDDVVMRSPSCIGLAIGAVQGNARTQRFYGDTGNRGGPNASRPDADTEFEIGSITKTFTATLLAYEDQAGRIRLDDPLARFAPPGIHVPSFEGRQILMVELAEHTSGLPRVVPRFTPPLTADVMWQFVSNYRLTRPPGEQFLYSNLGFGLLARAIVRRENATEDQRYARIITGPLGMRSTAINLSPAQHARLAQGYRPNGQPAPENAPTWPAFDGAGAVRSTLNDMMRYLDFELGKTNVALSSLLPALHQPRHAAGPNGSVGLGWQMRERADGVKTIFKDGATPGFSTFIIFTPATASGAVVLSNHRGCQVLRMGAQIIGALNGASESPFEPPLSDDEP